MKSMSFFERVSELGNLIVSSPLNLGMFFIFLLIAIFLILNIKRQNKVITYIFVGILLGLLAFVILGYHESILSGMDSLFQLIVLNVFFPSWIVYFALILISYGIILKTVLKKEEPKWLYLVNIICFCLIQFLFSLFLILVISQNLDLSNRIILYSHSEILTILQFSMTLFLIWILLLSVRKLIKKVDQLTTKSL